MSPEEPRWRLFSRHGICSSYFPNFAAIVYFSIRRGEPLNVPETQAGLDISARPLAQASVKTVGRDHSPGSASTIFSSRIYYSK